MTLGELKLWKRQAKAIERSPTHLDTIDAIIQEIEAGLKQDNIVLPTCEIELPVYRILLRDRTKFHQLAFSLIKNQIPQQSEKYDFDDDV